VEALLDAFRTLAERRPAVHLVVVGDGPQLAQLQGTARAWGLEPRVTFAGAVAHEDVPGWLSLMDIAAAPYVPHDHFYFSPLKLFEYMAMGIPVVAGRIGQIEEVLSDGVHGLLHAPGDAAELAAALERLVDDPGSRKRLGEAGRRVVFEERTWRRNAERILEIAAGLAARTEPARAGGRSRT